MRSILPLSVLVAGLSLAMFGSGPVLAGGNGADRIRDFACFIGLAPVAGGGVLTQDTWVVLTPSGNTNFHCRADLPLPVTPPDRAVRVTGLGCNTQGGFTTNHKKVFTPSGVIHLVCQINGSN
jgi:hypothetical protein